MNTDDFDESLRRELDEPPLPDRGFTSGVMARIDRARRRRRVLFAAAAAIALAVVGAAVGTEITPGTVMAALLLITISSLAWMDGESVS
jgi:hypothetical protein